MRVISIQSPASSVRSKVSEAVTFKLLSFSPCPSESVRMWEAFFANSFLDDR